MWFNLFAGIVTAFVCVVVTVLSINWLTSDSGKWFEFVSYSMIGLAACSLVAVAITGGWIAATSLTTTYVLLLLIPLRVGLHFGMGAVCTLWFAAQVLTIEFVLVVKFLRHLPT
jgi:hypothetical protein